MHGTVTSRNTIGSLHQPREAKEKKHGEFDPDPSGLQEESSSSKNSSIQKALEEGSPHLEGGPRAFKVRDQVKDTSREIRKFRRKSEIVDLRRIKDLKVPPSKHRLRKGPPIIVFAD
ncbi:hypothetical protein Nepgr_015753 [Nepenthes gracilis]|uniref:Uncharacterized protein n=1 Tax=Nepenthes gracilis TaxID=150966 RepID=A0AAD3SML5_NEPGR|nr:hypothetical protein Nepgr_015753 [Nepenthes gracilis]